MRFTLIQSRPSNLLVSTVNIWSDIANRIFKVIYSYLVQRQTHHCTQRTPWDYRKAVLLTVKWEFQGKAMWICTLTLLSQIPSLAVPTRCNLLTVKWEFQGKAMWICTLTLLSQIPSLAVPTRCNLRGCTFKCWSATRRNESNTARTLRPSELSKQNHKCYSKLGLRTLVSCALSWTILVVSTPPIFDIAP